MWECACDQQRDQSFETGDFNSELYKFIHLVIINGNLKVFALDKIYTHTLHSDGDRIEIPLINKNHHYYCRVLSSTLN